MTTRATLFQTMATTYTTGATALTTTTAILSVMDPTLPRHRPHTTPGNFKSKSIGQSLLQEKNVCSVRRRFSNTIEREGKKRKEAMLPCDKEREREIFSRNKGK